MPLIYLVFFFFSKHPLKKSCFKQVQPYLKVDYTGVIDELEGVAQAVFQRHRNMSWRRLARLEFLRTKEKVSTITPKSGSFYLHYWIYIGRHDFTPALDTAKRIDDSDLIIALRKEIKATRDVASSGEQREEAF